MTSHPTAAASQQGVSDVLPMDIRHLSQASELTRAVGWPARLEDWEVALRLGRGFVVELNGEVVGTALWWPYGDDFGSTGMIIVADKAQRRGIGARLMDVLLADAKGRTIILNSTVEGKTLYTRLGFQPYDVVRQHQAVLDRPPPVDPAVPLRDAAPYDWPAIVAIDEAAAGMPRREMLEAVGAIAEKLVIERDGRLCGYGFVRRWGRGVVIGPVVARDAGDAVALIAALAARHVGDFVRIDVPGSSDLSPWLDKIGLPRVDEVVSMSLGAPPRAAQGTALFALANQSFG